MAKVSPHNDERLSPMKQFSLRLDDEVRYETPRVRQDVAPPVAKVPVSLDGFLLLDTCRVEFPEEASRADVNGLNITAVVSDDLQYFTNLLFLDMSDNQAPLEPLGAFPVLKELDFQCNALHKIDNLTGFECLEWLNLSFNCLVSKDVEELSKLPKLRELYLASNWITSVPPIMDRFTRLETLSLERNNIHGTGIFLLLAVVPRLKNLNLSHNKISEFPESALALGDKQGAGFYHLAYLNLSHNKIVSEDDIRALTQLRVLSQLVLYGNPLAHAAVQTQDKTKLVYNPVPIMSECDGREVELNIVIAYPETKRKKPSYKNVSIARVKQDLLPTTAEFKAKGKRALFADPAPRPELATIFPPRQPLRQHDEEAPEAVAEPDMTFLTGVGLETSGPQSTKARRRKDPGAVQNDVPSYFLARSLAPNSESQQVKLKTAMANLRYQLTHPLTSHNDERLNDDVSAVRPTAVHKLRQRKKFGQAPRGRFALASIDQAIDDVNARLHNRGALSLTDVSDMFAVVVDVLDEGDTSLNHLVRQAQRMTRKQP
ncbi:hypothetical protein SDRG_01224 [Saprolegnia diclina VS20]|uniref:Uncharacterized protein n=1 Tax=Saprolegnia diclina (strain VS20) TaxID=1156394 RepID=T0QSV0_SAPDV|nr:hypothetical protein SDRG_01224 [Saprolegnia diclina VS20]EQC41249.1 hypothetical protein SDRG_01224 [Saprolegnia diclina VS20]|eukprot:XP_008604963.1 hypothetical protein SDRG_01224 [Saprolegnia diclina VS20]